MKKSIFNAIYHDGGTEEGATMPTENTDVTEGGDGAVATSEESRHYYM